jgi:hypothetical protein
VVGTAGDDANAFSVRFQTGVSRRSAQDRKIARDQLSLSMAIDQLSHRGRDLVVAVIVNQLVAQHSKRSGWLVGSASRRAL